MDFEAQRKQRMSALEEKRKKLEEMRKQRDDRSPPQPSETSSSKRQSMSTKSPGRNGDDGDSKPRSIEEEMAARRAASSRSAREDDGDAFSPERRGSAIENVKEQRKTSFMGGMDALVQSLIVQEASNVDAKNINVQKAGAAISSTIGAVPRSAVSQLLNAAQNVNKRNMKTTKGLAICNISSRDSLTYDKATDTSGLRPGASTINDDDEDGDRESIDDFDEDRSALSRPSSKGNKFRIKGSVSGDYRAKHAPGSASGAPGGRARSVMGDGRARSVMGDIKTRRVRFGGGGPSAALGSMADMVFSRTLSQFELDEITATSDFKDFLENASLTIERLLTQQDSLAFRRYSSAGNKDSAALNQHEVLAKPIKYADKNVTDRPVLDLQHSPFYPELFVAAYGSVRAQGKYSVASADSSAGFVCVWSTALAQRPEFRFTASSPVQTAHFHSTDPHLIVGGCYSGQVLLWDMRAKTLPIQRSSMGGQRGHKHPIVSLAMAGSGASHEMMSVSVDGTVCSWDLSRLSEPITTTTIPLPVVNKDAFTFTVNPLDTLRVSSVAFGFEGKREAFRSAVLGSETGRLFTTTMPYRPNDPLQLNTIHSGLVSSTHLHPSSLSSYKNLLLTASLDWSVKLWNLEAPTDPVLEILSPSFDYITDVKWCPVIPNMFASITSGGELQIWDLAFSTTVPKDTIQVMQDKVEGVKNLPVKEAVNKVAWSRDGHQVMVGDSRGVVHVVPVEDKALIPRQGAESRFKDIVSAQSKSRSVVDETSRDNKPSVVSEEFLASILSGASSTPRQE